MKDEGGAFWDDVFEVYEEFRCELDILLDELEAENPGLRERVEECLRKREKERGWNG